jgi:prepilin-type N-terminal cleavage/methylation domain-containing protein
MLDPALIFAHRTYDGRRRDELGMTIAELMIVVVIVGILAAIAGISYTSYIRRSRAQEARAMLLTIASREAAYRAEFAQYCSAGRTTGSPPTAVGIANAWPATAASAGAASFTNSMPVEWAQLGFRPTGNVRFRYVVVAGAPPAAPPGETGFSGSPNQDLWYVAEAYGDLDGDNNLSTFHLFSGNGNTLTITNERE